MKIFEMVTTSWYNDIVKIKIHQNTHSDPKKPLRILEKKIQIEKASFFLKSIKKDSFNEKNEIS
jgi:hypothetical protein